MSTAETVSYDVYLFESEAARNQHDFSKARLLGEASSFADLQKHTQEHTGPLGYAKRETTEWVSYANVMASWDEKPWSEEQ